VLEREHAAPGSPEQVDPVKAQLRAHCVHLFAEDGHRPLDVPRPVRAATADLVVTTTARSVASPSSGAK